MLGDGSFVSPFLNDKDYSFHLRKGFSLMDEKYEGKESYTKALQALYFKHWEAPSAEAEEEEDASEEWTMIIPVNMWTVSILAFSVFMSMYVLCKFWWSYSFGYDGYKLIGSNDADSTTTMV